MLGVVFDVLLLRKRLVVSRVRRPSAERIRRVRGVLRVVSFSVDGVFRSSDGSERERRVWTLHERRIGAVRRSFSENEQTRALGGDVIFHGVYVGVSFGRVRVGENDFLTQMCRRRRTRKTRNVARSESQGMLFKREVLFRVRD